MRRLVWVFVFGLLATQINCNGGSDGGGGTGPSGPPPVSKPLPTDKYVASIIPSSVKFSLTGGGFPCASDTVHVCKGGTVTHCDKYEDVCNNYESTCSSYSTYCASYSCTGGQTCDSQSCDSYSCDGYDDEGNCVSYSCDSYSCDSWSCDSWSCDDWEQQCDNWVDTCTDWSYNQCVQSHDECIDPADEPTGVASRGWGVIAQATLCPNGAPSTSPDCTTDGVTTAGGDPTRYLLPRDHYAITSQVKPAGAADFLAVSPSVSKVNSDGSFQVFFNGAFQQVTDYLLELKPTPGFLASNPSMSDAPIAQLDLFLSASCGASQADPLVSQASALQSKRAPLTRADAAKAAVEKTLEGSMAKLEDHRLNIAEVAVLKQKLRIAQQFHGFIKDFLSQADRLASQSGTQPARKTLIAYLGQMDALVNSVPKMFNGYRTEKALMVAHLNKGHFAEVAHHMRVLGWELEEKVFKPVPAPLRPIMPRLWIGQPASQAMPTLKALSVMDAAIQKELSGKNPRIKTRTQPAVPQLRLGHGAL